MGAVSSCCSVEPAPDKMKEEAENVPEAPIPPPVEAGRMSMASAPPKQKTTPKHSDGPGEGLVTQNNLEKFQRKLEEQLPVVVLLADGTHLSCQLTYRPNDKSLAISCETNLRIVQLSEIRAILHGRDQLKRVETKAILVDDPHCVALHLSTGNCIPLRLDSLDDKECFVELMKRLK